MKKVTKNVNLYFSNFPRWFGRGWLTSTSSYVNSGMLFNTLGGIFGGSLLNKKIPFSNHFHFACIWLRKYFIAILFAKVSISGAQKCHSWYLVSFSKDPCKGDQFSHGLHWCPSLILLLFLILELTPFLPSLLSDNTCCRSLQEISWTWEFRLLSS